MRQDSIPSWENCPRIEILTDNKAEKRYHMINTDLGGHTASRSQNNIGATLMVHKYFFPRSKAFDCHGKMHYV